ncbi:hypothetical protein ACHAW6_010347 [Cyclotella cf. meneghiniana]
MARTFMVHVSLHWSESGVNDMSLGEFVVKYSVWIRNHIPNQFQGLLHLNCSPTPKADHRDLLHSHVWGTPGFVLDHKLQDGKKILK